MVPAACNIEQATGNVTIGSTGSPSSLTVTGDEIISNGTASGFNFQDRNSSYSTQSVWYQNNDVTLLWRSDVGTVLGITDTGAVGIGTTSPSQQLQLTANELLPIASGDTVGNLFLGGNTAAGTNGLRLFSDDSAGGGFMDVKASTTEKGIIFRR